MSKVRKILKRKANLIKMSAIIFAFKVNDIYAEKLPAVKDFSGLDPNKTQNGVIMFIRQYIVPLSAVGILITILLFGLGLWLASLSNAKDQKVDASKGKFAVGMIGCFIMAASVAIAVIVINIMNNMG